MKPDRAAAPRPAEHYIIGDCDAVWVPTAVVARLLRDPGLQLDAWRRRHRGDDPDTDAVMVAMRLVTLAHTGDAVARSGHYSAPQQATGARSLLTTSQVADRLGCSLRTARRLGEHNTLPSELVANRRFFDADAVEQYRTRRAA